MTVANVRRALLADDEPFYLEWLEDFLEGKGLSVDYATSVDSAIDRIRNEKYEIIVVDLNIPMIEDPTAFAKRMTSAYDRYPGLYVANAARNSGYSDRKVIIYSVFAEKEVEEAAEKLYCTYLTKLHPSDLRNAISRVVDAKPAKAKTVRRRKVASKLASQGN